MNGVDGTIYGNILLTRATSTWPGKHPATWAKAAPAGFPILSLTEGAANPRYIRTGTNLLYAHGQIGTNQLRLNEVNRLMQSIFRYWDPIDTFCTFILFSSLIHLLSGKAEISQSLSFGCSMISLSANENSAGMWTKMLLIE